MHGCPDVPPPLFRNGSSNAPARYRGSCAGFLAAALLVCGCTQEMVDQPRLEALEASAFFQNGQSVRRPPSGTVARGQRWLDDPFFTGQLDDQPVSAVPSDPRTGQPFRITLEVLRRGRQRFDIFCSHCHGRAGYGDGMVVRRGFRKPPSLHEPRLRRETAPGHFFQVITDGFRTMPAQGSRISPADRWAIVAYIGALQKSQHLAFADAPQDIREQFQRSSTSRHER